MPDLWKPGEVAALLRVDAKTVTRWAAAGRLPSIKTPGGQARIPDAAVRELFTPGADHRAQYPADIREEL